MPNDIRSFFGAKPPGTVAEKAKPKADDQTKKRGRGRKIVDDDEDEDDEPATKKPAPSKKAPAKKAEPVLEETNPDDFFGKGKPKRTADTKPKPVKKEATAETPKKKAPAAKSKSAKSTPNGRGSTRAKKETNYIDLDADDYPDDDMEDGADDVHKTNAATGRRLGDDYQEATDDEDDKPLVPKKRESGKQKKLKDDDEDDFEPDGDIDMKDTNPDDDFVVPDEDERIVEDKPAKKTPAKAAAKRKSTALDDDEDDLEIEQAKPAKKRAAPTKKATPAKKQKAGAPEDSAELKAIFASIPTIDPPPPPPKDGDDGEKKKFQFGGQHANSAVPAGALDSSDIPVGNDNCLAGLKFVFTGQLQRLGREQGQALVKQYGGHVMSAPSKNTSYVVLGEDAGPKKLETIAKIGLKVINEDGLFALISKLPANGGDGAAAEKHAEKVAKEEEKIRAAAAEIDEQEKAKAAAAAKAAAKAKAAQPSSAPQTESQQAKAKAAADAPDSRLWTVRYAPQSLSHICGNKSQVEKLQNWLRAFPKNQRTGFKMAGKDGSGTHRAIIIHGPPGIGKTTAAHLVAKIEGYDIVESNASDTRSKKLVETGLKGVLSTTSLMGYFSKGTDEVEAGKKKIVLIMDEIDGMSAGDRGGVGALAAVCKKTQVPMILICNDRKLPKMKPFDFVTFDLPFRRPTTDMIRSRIMTIAYREGLKMPQNVINALIEGSGADIRQVVNMISTAKLDEQNMTFEDSKDMSKAWQKHIILKPWDMVGKILGGGLFNPSANSTLNDKTEIYFNDHDFAPLMLQENYLGTNPARSNQHNDNKKLKRLSELDLVSKAADSISDGDLVDRMIHGSQQQWSLMPVHAVFSFVRPASFVYGSMAGNQTRFASWLGKNSSQGKLTRFVKEIQGHMRLRVSADRHEIRQTYLPMLFEKLIVKLRDEGKEAVPEIIELMDSYFLTKDDWDAILELGVGQADMEGIKIESQAKATFTRLYNQQSHPLPFMKASEVVAPKKAPPKEKPDLEEAFEESEDEAPAEDEKKEDDLEADLSKDKYVAKPKKKKASAAGSKASASSKTSGSKASGKGKKKAAVDDDEEDEEDVKPKKGKGKAKK